MTNHWLEQINKFEEPNLFFEKITHPSNYMVGLQNSCLKTNAFKGKTEIRDGKDYYKWSTTTHSNYQYDLFVRFYDKEMSSLLIANVELTQVPVFSMNEAVGNNLKINLHDVNDADLRLWSWLSNVYPDYSAPLAAPKRGLGLLWAFDYEKGDYAILPINGLMVQDFGASYTTTYTATHNLINVNLKFDKMWFKKVR